MVVQDGATLYTIEGVAAALLMIATATIVFQAISIYTPGDTHIDDMLLEQLGADALAVMDMPRGQGEMTLLEEVVQEWRPDIFDATFSPLLRERSFGAEDPIQYSAEISYRIGDGVESVTFSDPPGYVATGRDPAVRVTRWVQIHPGHSLPIPSTGRSQAVLLEVILWRG